MSLVKIGESENQGANSPVSWHAAVVGNVSHDILGMMHRCVREGDLKRILARQNVIQETMQG